MKKKQELHNILIILLLLFFCVGMVVVCIYLDYYKGGDGIFFSEYNKELPNNLKEILESQSKMNEKIRAAINNNEYTLDKPLIIRNPYKINPLSALVIFNTLESVSINVYLNDVLITITDYDNEHVIPIYGLYSNARNIIKLVSSDGIEKTIEVVCEPYNNYLFDYNLALNMNGFNQIFIAGKVNTNNYVRAFDYNNNLIFYLDLDNVDGYELINNHLFVNYNPRNGINSNLSSIQLEIDYLGRIIGINNNYLDFNEVDQNLVIDNNSFIMRPTNIYPEIMPKYIPVPIVENMEETEYRQYKLPILNKEILNAKLYPNNYTIVYMADYITYDFDDLKPDSKLLFVSKDNIIKEMNIYDKNIIKVYNVKDTVLYLKQDDVYYNLLLELKN